MNWIVRGNAGSPALRRPGSLLCAVKPKGFLLLAAFGMLASLSAMEIIGHRGASFDAPENTAAAFKVAYEQQSDAAELDIYLTRDGKIVVIHDGTTKRTGGLDRKVADQTLEELRQLNVGQWEQWAGKGFHEKPPTLAEALALVPPGKRLFIEIKCQSEILPPLAQAFSESKLTAGQTPIITFHYDVARDAKKAFPDREVYWLYGWAKDKQTGEFPKIDDLIEKAKAAGLDGLDLHWQFPIDRAFVKQVHAAGLKLYTWTVDDPAVAQAEAVAGVDGITTNRPGWLREQLAKTH